VDAERIRDFVEHDYARVVNVVALVCGDRGRAEDAVQDALVRAWDSRRPIDALGPWVTTVALNRARDVARRASAESRAYARMGVAAEAVVAREVADFDALLAALPRRQREVVVLHYYADLPVVEVARLLEVSEGTVKTCLFRARETLARSLDEVSDVEA
jgi:RNA polymerase sigma-70 factor (ECF subfamily)